MSDEKYDIQVNFFTKDNVASLEQFRDNISKLGSSIQRQRAATGGGAGILGSILMGGLLGRVTSRLGGMTREMRRHKGARENNIRIRKKQRETGSGYEKTLEAENEALRERIEKESQDALRQGRAEGIQDAQKRAFGRLEKRTLESAQTKGGGLKFTSSAKESRQSVIKANMEAKAYKERNSQLGMELKQAKEQQKNSNMIKDALIDENKSLTDSMKKVTTEVSHMENKTKNNIIKFPDQNAAKPKQQEVPLMAAKEVKEIAPPLPTEVAKPVSKNADMDAAIRTIDEGMRNKKTRNPASVEKGQQEKNREEQSDEDIQNKLYKMRRNEQAQEGVQ